MDTYGYSFGEKLILAAIAIGVVAIVYIGSMAFLNGISIDIVSVLRQLSY
jgi:hypothetical protein